MKALNKKVAAFAFAGIVAFGAVGCSSERGGTTEAPSGEAVVEEGESSDAGACSFSADGLVGVAMPTKSLERWNRDGADLQALLEGMGYKVDLQYADNKPEMQISQLENMINAGAEVLVVASIDGEALGPVLESAAEKDIPVIAYDRLIKGTDAVDYYASFDNEKVGTLQGEYIVEHISEGDGPYNLEMFAGSPDDNNARFFFKGAYDVLTPYIEDGTLVVQSGKLPSSVDEWQTIGIQGWEGSKAQSEMENRLNSYYRDQKVDVVLSPNDSLALGIAEALQGNGYAAGSEDYPILTGQDADEANVNNIIAGAQSMTVWKDTRELGDVVANMVNEIMTCSDVTVNNTEDYDNDVKVVPSYLLEPVVVTQDNIQEKLVDSGFLPDLKVG